ncbi:MAG: flagellar biosynthesis protein FlgI [Robiginitomaculum sp.]|nr:MAG: flagellar biosynthesis protein FlgI [Robiginitomaculum sp.]
MRINATSRPQASGKAKVGGKVGNGSGFSLPGGDAQKTGAPAAAMRASPVSSVEALIALQESDDFRQARKKATARADDLLDALSDLRLGLLEGGIPLRTLHRLSARLASTRANTGDSRLESILNEIEVRAEVEKAKLDFTH